VLFRPPTYLLLCQDGLNHVGPKQNKEDNNLMEKCEECGSYDLKVDNARGEIVCNNCGLVIDDQASMDQNDNAGTMWGEHSFNTPTKDESKIKTGSKGNGLGSYIGKPGEAKGKWKLLSHLNSQGTKDVHPMAQATMDAAKDLAGKDNAMKAKKVITLATVPLEGDKAEALKEAANDEDIALPKNSVCRKKTRGGSTQNNERLLALACLKAHQERTGKVNIDWTQMVDNAGLTLQQVVDASKAVMKYLNLCEKAGLLEKRADRRAVQKELRNTEIENTTLRLKQLLHGLDESLKSKVMDDFQQRLFRLGEPTLDDSPLSSENIKASVLCAMLFQISCEAFGVEQGRLENIAKAIGRCRNTIKNKLKDLLKKVASGEIVDFGVLQEEF
tara:strand:+ start:55 stop:1215 length:1161 start_codon:yes stop_codon:yes gene_type:complete